MRRASISVLIGLGIVISSWQGWGARGSVERWVEPDVAAPPAAGLLSTQASQAEAHAALGSARARNEAAGPAAAATAGDETVAAIRDFLGQRHTALSSRDQELLAETIVVEARRHGLDPWLVLAVIKVESQCYHLAVSPVGAIGLMQLLPATGREVAQRNDIPWHGTDTLLDPISNVKLGTAYLKSLSQRFGNVSTALAAYNWGPGRIRSRLRNGAGLPSLYISQVMKAYDETPRRLASAS